MNGSTKKLSAKDKAAARAKKKAAARARKKLVKAELKKKEAQIVANLERAKKEDEEAAKAIEANGETAVEAVEYVAANDLEITDNPEMEEFKRIFDKFSKPEELTAERKDEEEEAAATEEKKPAAEEKLMKAESDKPLSRKKLKLKNRLSIAELKQLVEKPDVVEFHDANAADPKLLVHLKSYRNTVPVPDHWGSKRKYLMGKRGYEKPAFELPKFIQDTGISQIRQAQQDRDESKSQAQKMKDRMQPKMGKIDIDYQVLHDAFFRFQVKPDLTRFGNMYYEGRELEVKLKAKRPGQLSNELKRALGMIDATSPPPWLFNLQRFGPPPKYKALKIPGVNCPIPPGARYGFGPGEWGKPPVDEYGRPLYGDVFGTQAAKEAENEGVDKGRWAELQEEDEEEEDEDDEEEDEDEDEDDMESGLESVSSLGSTSEVETPASVPLRKATEDTTTEGSDAPKSLYTVLEQKSAGVGSDSLFGSQHTYAMPAQSESEKRIAAAKSKASGQVEVALNPEDLEKMDAVTLKRKYEAQLEAEKNAKKPEDVSDVIEENRLKKRKTSTKKKQQKYKF